MRPTEILMQEHRVIEQILDCLEIMAQRGEADGEFDVESANQAVDFFRNFADRCHHGKEDQCLFQMTDQAMSEQDQWQLLESFAHVEHDDLGPGTHEKYLKIAAELAKRYGAECRVSGTTSGDSSCGHH